MLNGDTTKVVNYYETEGFKKTVEVMKRWYDKGYVYKDTATNTEAGTDLILQDKGFSYFSGSDGQFASINASCGREMVAFPINIVPTTTSLFTNWTWAIPTCATVHLVEDLNGNKIPYILNMTEESDGTNSYFKLIGIVKKM